jgi:hypothetical protein
MIDIRLGPLSVYNDPFSTAAERVVNLKLPKMTPAEIEALDNLPDMPWRVAYPGYRDDAGVACYFKDDVLGWVDTLTLEPWPGRDGETRQLRFAANWKAKATP